jgi:hypothetical protein
LQKDRGLVKVVSEGRIMARMSFGTLLIRYVFGLKLG